MYCLTARTETWLSCVDRHTLCCSPLVAGTVVLRWLPEPTWARGQTQVARDIASYVALCMSGACNKDEAAVCVVELN